jgi:hypothetical protein
MLIKTDNPQTLWIHCSECGKSFHPGGHCKCGNIRTQTDRRGVTKIIAEDSDKVIYDND